MGCSPVRRARRWGTRKEFLDRQAVEVIVVEAQRQYDNFVKSLKNNGLRKDTGPFLVTIR